MRRSAPVIVILSLLAAACGGDAGTPSTTTTLAATTTSTSAPSTTTQPAETTTTIAATTTTAPTTTTTPGPTWSTLAGEPVEFGPVDGAVLMVIGVRFDDVLNLRAQPGAGQPIVGRIPPTYANLVALGHTRQLPNSFWTEVDYSGDSGWVHMSYVGYEGVTSDETAYVTDQLGEIPTAATMRALGVMVADLYSSDDLFSDVVQVTEVTSGDLAEVTYDVVGLADDSVLGVRLHIFAEKGGGGFTLKSVETTVICGRGVDVDDFCV
ncbi:MAG TPA: SH3 domain-containing protein [Acidimicrobiia bacterium]|nr:SH3 domain-containing protein [Acidimicrobiia bacterium]